MAATPAGPVERSGASSWGAVYRHRWKVLLAGVLMACVAWFAAGQLIAASYEATATITLSKDRPFDPTATGNNAANLGDPTQWAKLQAAVVQSDVVLNAATAATATPATVPVPVEDLDDLLTITPVTDTNQITVTASADTATGAADLANAVATAYQTTTLAQVTAARDAAITAVAPDVDQTTAIVLAALNYGSGVASIDVATPPEQAAPPYAWQVALVGGLVGLLFAASAVAWGAHLKQRVTGAPLNGVAELGRWKTLPPVRRFADPSSSASRSAGVVLVGLQHLGHLRVPRLEVGSVLVTATSGNAGALATGLAVSAARTGHRVVMVHAAESGGRSGAVGQESSSRRAGVLAGDVRPWVVDEGVVVGVLALNASELQPHRVGPEVRSLVEEGYLVILVGGSVVSSPAAFAIAGEVDAVLVQVEADPRAEVVSKTLAQLSIAAPPVLAQVVVGDIGSAGGADGRQADPGHPLSKQGRAASPEVTSPAGRRG